MIFGKNTRRAVLIPILLVLQAAVLRAQTPPAQVLDILKFPRDQKIVISRVTGPITLDGKSDDLGWKEVRPLDLAALQVILWEADPPAGFFPDPPAEYVP